MHLLQRKTTKVGAGLGKTTGWIHRTELRHRGVTMIAGAEYHLIDDAGLHLTVDGERRVIEVDTVVLCAGQEPRRELYDTLLRGRARRPSDRRRGCRGGAGRQARHRAGHRAGGGPVTGPGAQDPAPPRFPRAA